MPHGYISLISETNGINIINTQVMMSGSHLDSSTTHLAKIADHLGLQIKFQVANKGKVVLGGFERVIADFMEFSVSYLL